VEGGLLLAIVVVLVLTTLADARHTYWFNYPPSAVDLVRQTALLGIFALGAALVIIAGGIDLSSGSVIAFSGTICATLMVLLAPEAMENPKLSVPLWVIVVSILGTLVVGLLIGSLHAWLITVVGLPPFVATLATLVGLRSVGRALVEFITFEMLSTHQRSSQIQIFDERFRDLTKSVWIQALLCLLLTIACWVLMTRTVLGRHLHALGGNEQAARLSGIRTDGLKWLAYCLSAVLASLAGILYIGEQAVADPQTLGRGYELNAIAAAVVGGCSLQGGVGTIPGVMLGTLFLRVVIDGVSKIIKSGADIYEGLIVGGVVVVAVAFNELRQTRRTGRRFFPGLLGLVTTVNFALFAGTLAALLGLKMEWLASRLGLGSGGASLLSGGLVGLLTLLVFLGVWFAGLQKR
jgi:ribose/xylose/arabinose/galactoside ABC-type transport system permease subunit